MTDAGMVGDAAGWYRGPPEDLCLAFANTRYWRGMPSPTDDLSAPADLLRWCVDPGGVPAATGAAAAAHWAADPAGAASALTAALALREALYRLFSSAAGGTPAQTADLATLNAALATHPRRTRLRARPDGVGWAVADPPPGLGMLLAPVLWSAGDLLAGRRLPRVRCCANPQCRYLFLDDSKAATRRWCAMASCGNRAKAHRHYAKLKATRHGDGQQS